MAKHVLNRPDSNVKRMDIITSYYELTLAIETMTGMPNDMLHVHAGMLIYLLSQFMLGSRRGSWMALSIVLEAEVFNEMMNYFYHGSWRWADTSKDVVLTLFWPTMCVIVSKYRRWRWARKEERRRELAAVLNHSR